MKHTRRHTGRPRKAGKTNRSRSHSRRARRLHGGDDERSAAEIAEQFGLVKRTYADIASRIDDEYNEYKDYIEDCCYFKGTLPKDSFFLGESNDGTTVVMVSKSANKELIRKLENMKPPLEVIMLEKDLKFHLSDGWDHALDTGHITSRSFSIDGKSHIGHIKYAVSFRLDGDYSEEHGTVKSRYGSWGVGAGDVTYRPEWKGSYEKRVNKNMPTAILTLREKGMVDDVIGMIGEKVKSGYGRPEQIPDVRIVKSALYMPAGKLDDQLKMDETTQDVIDEAKERYEEDEPRRKREQEYWDSMGPGMYDAPDSPDMGYGYGGYDDDYYGGRRRRRHMTRGRGRGRRVKASRAVTKRKARR